MSVIGKIFRGGGIQQQVQPSPQINIEPPPPDQESLRKAGRAALLISTSPSGVLGKPKTGRSTLLSAT